MIVAAEPRSTPTNFLELRVFGLHARNFLRSGEKETAA